MFKTIKAKIILSGIIAVLIPVVMILTLISREKENISKTVVNETSGQFKQYVQSVAKSALTLCESHEELLEKVMQSNMNVTLETIKKGGGLTLDSSTIEWKAIN